MSAERVKLTKAQRDVLRHVLKTGPDACLLTPRGNPPYAVDQLRQLGLLETLNRLRPGPTIYEITEAGRAALSPAGDRS